MFLFLDFYSVFLFLTVETAGANDKLVLAS